jgi:hypothetical protein
MTNNMDTYGAIVCVQKYIIKWFVSTLFYLKRFIPCWQINAMDSKI